MSLAAPLFPQPFMGTRTTSMLPLALGPLDRGKLRIGTGCARVSDMLVVALVVVVAVVVAVAVAAAGTIIVVLEVEVEVEVEVEGIGDHAQRRAEKTEHVRADKS
jgi:hypothetical protein